MIKLHTLTYFTLGLIAVFGIGDAFAQESPDCLAHHPFGSFAGVCVIDYDLNTSDDIGLFNANDSPVDVEISYSYFRGEVQEYAHVSESNLVVGIWNSQVMADLHASFSGQGIGGPTYWNIISVDGVDNPDYVEVEPVVEFTLSNITMWKEQTSHYDGYWIGFDSNMPFERAEINSFVNGESFYNDHSFALDRDGKGKVLVAHLTTETGIITAEIFFEGVSYGIMSINTDGQIVSTPDPYDQPAVPEQEPVVATLQTDDPHYIEGDTIFVSGQVLEKIGETPVIVQLFTEGNLVDIVQLTVAADGSFTKTFLAEGALWKTAAEYTVRASYGEHYLETSFTFTPDTSQTETSGVYEVDAGSHGTFDVRYSIQGASITNMVVDRDDLALIVQLDSFGDGELNLEIPRAYFGAVKSNGQDDTFIILLDGIEVAYNEITSGSDSRKISIDIRHGDRNVEIIGTYVVGATSPPTPEPTETTISVMTNFDEYEFGHTIVISGEVVGELNSGTIVNIKTIASNGELQSTFEVGMNDDKQFRGELYAGGQFESGTYTVTAKYGNIGGPSDTTTFEFVTDEPTNDDVVTIQTVTGSSDTSCGDTLDGCFTPRTANIDRGGQVIFNNIDSAFHTFTSGTPTEGASGLFDSSFVATGDSYQWIATESTHYFCTIHPWSTGTIIVDGDSIPDIPTPESTQNPILTMEINDDVFYLNDILNVEGTIVNPTSTSHVIWQIISSSNIIQLGTETIDYYGNFEIDYQLSSMPEGTYYIKVSYDNKVEQESFYYNNVLTSTQPEPEEELEIISLSTKKSQYRTGDTIVITGKVSTSDFSKPVTLQVFTGASLVDISQASVSLNESFSRTIVAEGPLWMNDGKYTIKATYGNDSEITSFVYRYVNSQTDPNCGPGTVWNSQTNACVLAGYTPPVSNSQVTIEPAQGSGAPGCEDTAQGCYLPSTANVKVGGSVKFSNTDNAAHTYTSGDASKPDTVQVIFDSGLMMTGSTYEWSPEVVGEVPYFCMVHPWMVGLIIVHEMDSQDIIDEVNDTPTFPDKLPDWVRHIFVWYGQGLVDDQELVEMIEYLIEINVISVQ